MVVLGDVPSASSLRIDSNDDSTIKRFIFLVCLPIGLLSCLAHFGPESLPTTGVGPGEQVPSAVLARDSTNARREDGWVLQSKSVLSTTYNLFRGLTRGFLNPHPGPRFTRSSIPHIEPRRKYLTLYIDKEK